MLTETMSLAHRLDGTDDEWCQAIFDSLLSATRSLGEPFVMFGSMMGNMRLERAVAREEGKLARMKHEAPDVPPALRAMLIRRGPLYRLMDVPIDEGLADERYPTVSPSSYLERMGVSEEFWFLQGMGVDGNGIVVGIDLSRRATAADVRELEATVLAVLHVGAAWRLRRALSASQSEGSAGSVEAVLSPDGRLLHAGGIVVDRPMRAVLQGAARSLPQAKDPLSRLLAQRVLVAGRWTLVDHTDTDGKRLVLARVNDPLAPGAVLPALSHRERQVAMWLSLGCSLKQIAYELGLAISTIHASEQRARRKLGVASRAALVVRVQAAVDEILVSEG